MNSPSPHAPLAGPHAVSTEKLVKRYGDLVALDGVDLQVPEGAVYVLAGSNGAGKTTLMEILLGLSRPSSGSASVFGRDARRQGSAVRAQIGYVAARHDWGYKWLTVAKLIRHHAAFYPTWDDAYAARLIKLFALPLDRKFGTLSRGHARRAQLVLALAHRPPLLLLDEPTDGLDRAIRDELMGIFAEHVADSPTTVVVSTHFVYEFDPLADHLGVLRDGRLLAQVPREKLHRMLRRYRADVPDRWTPPGDLNGSVLKATESGREIQWVIWGEQHNVARHLRAAGASIREASPLTLDDAVLAFLNPRHQ